VFRKDARQFVKKEMPKKDAKKDARHPMLTATDSGDRLYPLIPAPSVRSVTGARSTSALQKDAKKDARHPMLSATDSIDRLSS
jgi:hypothetical protein